jgi:hypothetical protein
MTYLNYQFIENGPLANEDHRAKYHFPLKVPGTLPVLLLPNFLDSNSFNILLYQTRQASIQKAIDAAVTSSGVGKPLEHSVVTDVRITSILPVVPIALEIEKEKIKAIIKSYWQVESPIEPNHGWQCLQYNVGGHYRWHSDGFNFRDGKWNLYYPQRSFALIFFMNTWIHGYPQLDNFSGGELVFTHIVDQFNNRLTVYPKANTLVVFPTTSQYQHQVNIVREGTRFSFVNWIGDPNATA